MKNWMGLFTMALTIGLYSCSMDSLVEDGTEEKTGADKNPGIVVGRTLGVDDILDNNWPVDAFSRCHFNIKNEEPSLYLEVCGLSINNLYRSGTMIQDDTGSFLWSSLSEQGEVFIPLDRIGLSYNEDINVEVDGYFIPQNVSPWLPVCHPKMQTGAYVWLDCIIYNICDENIGYQAGLDIPIWSDGEGGSCRVAIPLSIDFKAGQVQDIILTLKNGEPWYNVEVDIPQPVLVPIEFDITVDDWGKNFCDIEF